MQNTGPGMNLGEALNILSGVKARRKKTPLATVAVVVLGFTGSLLFTGAVIVLGALSVFGLYHLGAWII